MRKGETACSLSISEHFPKVSEETSKVPEGQRNASDYFPKMFEDYGRLLKTTKDLWGRTDDVLIVKEHTLVLFKGLCKHSNGELFAWGKKEVISVYEMACYFHVWRYYVYAWYFTNNNQPCYKTYVLSRQF